MSDARSESDLLPERPRRVGADRHGGARRGERAGGAGPRRGRGPDRAGRRAAHARRTLGASGAAAEVPGPVVVPEPTPPTIPEPTPDPAPEPTPDPSQPAPDPEPEPDPPVAGPATGSQPARARGRRGPASTEDLIAQLRTAPEPVNGATRAPDPGADLGAARLVAMNRPSTAPLPRGDRRRAEDRIRATCPTWTACWTRSSPAPAGSSSARSLRLRQIGTSVRFRRIRDQWHRAAPGQPDRHSGAREHNSGGVDLALPRDARW